MTLLSAGIIAPHQQHNMVITYLTHEVCVAKIIFGRESSPSADRQAALPNGQATNLTVFQKYPRVKSGPRVNHSLPIQSIPENQG